MPTYEYQCEKCGHEWEREQRISEAPIKSCPKCKAQKARRLISATSFVLKGGGWYSDLYSSSGSKKKSEPGASESAASSGSSSSSESSSASSSEPKSKPKPKSSTSSAA